MGKLGLTMIELAIDELVRRLLMLRMTITDAIGSGAQLSNDTEQALVEVENLIEQIYREIGDNDQKSCN